jgi:hypothetical protein
MTQESKIEILVFPERNEITHKLLASEILDSYTREGWQLTFVFPFQKREHWYSRQINGLTIILSKESV